MKTTMSRTQSIPAGITPEALNDLLNASIRSRGGNWRVTRISRRKNSISMDMYLTKRVRISI